MLAPRRGAIDRALANPKTKSAKNRISTKIEIAKAEMHNILGIRSSFEMRAARMRLILCAHIANIDNAALRIGLISISIVSSNF